MFWSNLLFICSSRQLLLSDFTKPSDPIPREMKTDVHTKSYIHIKSVCKCLLKLYNLQKVETPHKSSSW